MPMKSASAPWARSSTAFGAKRFIHKMKGDGHGRGWRPRPQAPPTKTAPHPRGWGAARSNRSLQLVGLVIAGVDQRLLPVGGVDRDRHEQVGRHDLDLV